MDVIFFFFNLYIPYAGTYYIRVDLYSIDDNEAKYHYSYVTPVILVFNQNSYP